jgi:hypothetical protein
MSQFTFASLQRILLLVGLSADAAMRRCHPAEEVLASPPLQKRV